MTSLACALKSDLLPQVSVVAAGNEDEILSALSAPSLTNVIMAGFIRDNTLDSPLNRGHFYTYRSERNDLEGVALIGHTVLFEAFTERAVEAFAGIARREASAHLLMGEHNAVQRFWNYYAAHEHSPRQRCPVLFMRRPGPLTERGHVLGLRPATIEDLEQVVKAQAGMALATSGVDPLKKDPIGFRERYRRRIEKQRVWILMKDGRLLFKLDVIADTPKAAYIEGVYVNPKERGKGLGQRCLTEVGHILLKRTDALYLFVETEDARTRSFYSRLGFDVAGQYELLYF
jgi:ribosomal protein S18 acetylase RimI-like enzyme